MEALTNRHIRQFLSNLELAACEYKHQRYFRGYSIKVTICVIGAQAPYIP
jgi:hypothetical protein